MSTNKVTARCCTTKFSSNGKCRGLHKQVITKRISKQEQECEAPQRESNILASSKLAILSPEWHGDGSIRCNDQLKHAKFLLYDARFPVILSRDSPVIRLVVRYSHEEDNHSVGANNLLSMLSRGFWVVSGREVIKECRNHYMICKKNKAAPISHGMVPLPQFQVEIQHPTIQ